MEKLRDLLWNSRLNSQVYEVYIFFAKLLEPFLSFPVALCDIFEICYQSKHYYLNNPDVYEFSHKDKTVHMNY